MNDVPSWLDPQQPHEPDVSQRQIDGVLALLGSTPARVLDLGCGAGRILVPLAVAGHRCIGLDEDSEQLACCRQALRNQNADAELVEADMLQPWPPHPELATGWLDLICLLGNTLMTIADVDVAVKLLRAAAAGLNERGAIVIDDIPGLFWPEVTDGHWQSGLSEDQRQQLVWDQRDAVFVHRVDEDVDADCWQIKPNERRLRLWTDGELRLAATLAGLSVDSSRVDAHLLVLQPAQRSSTV